MKILVVGDDKKIVMADAKLLKGDDGRIGDPGPEGKIGLSGKDGRDGIDGRDGRVGVSGRDGIDGKSFFGSQGPAGIDGKDGKDGLSITGSRGQQGPAGKDGRDGIDGRNGADGRDAIYPTGATSGDVLRFGPNGAMWDKIPQPIDPIAGPGTRVKFNKVNARLTALEASGGGGISSVWVGSTFQPIGNYANSVDVSSFYALKSSIPSVSAFANSADVSSGFANLSNVKANSSALAVKANSIDVSSFYSPKATRLQIQMQVAFQPVTAATWTQVISNTVLYDASSSWNVASQFFNVPFTGWWKIAQSLDGQGHSFSGALQILCAITKNGAVGTGSILLISQQNCPSGLDLQAICSGANQMIHLSAGDKIQLNGIIQSSDSSSCTVTGFVGGSDGRCNMFLEYAPDA